MNILIIYAHPNSNSLNVALKDAFIEGLDKTKHTFTSIDLYAEKFNPVYEYDELVGKKLYPDVLRHQQLIAQSDLVVFFSPTWWYGEPAILKGYFDRVFVGDFAFNYGKIFGFTYPIRLLKGKRALWFKTMNSPWWWYWLGMGNWMVRNVVRGTLGFCGLSVKVYRIYGIVFQKNNPEFFKKHLNKIKKIASKL